MTSKPMVSRRNAIGSMLGVGAGLAASLALPASIEASATTDDVSVERATLSSGTLAIVVRAFGGVIVGVSEAVPPFLTDVVARHAQEHHAGAGDFWTERCLRDTCGELFGLPTTQPELPAWLTDDPELAAIFERIARAIPHVPERNGVTPLSLLDATAGLFEDKAGIA